MYNVCCPEAYKYNVMPSSIIDDVSPRGLAPKGKSTINRIQEYHRLYSPNAEQCGNIGLHKFFSQSVRHEFLRMCDILTMHTALTTLQLCA